MVKVIGCRVAGTVLVDWLERGILSYWILQFDFKIKQSLCIPVDVLSVEIAGDYAFLGTLNHWYGINHKNVPFV